MSQLPLAIGLDDDAVFETFHREGNDALVDHLERLCAQEERVGAWLWGRPASGKSHLLQAVCDRLGSNAVFLPLKELESLGPQVLDGMAERSSVCLDDLDAVAGQPDWERGLFNLFEAAREHEAFLVVTSSGPPREAGVSLRDLQSRLTQLPAFQVKSLDDKGRLQALALHAARRGLDLPDETAKFLARRARRDMASLYLLLDRLDDEALIAKRRLTIPFVREVLDV